MSVLPFYSPKFRAFDSNGDPLAGGLLYAYAAGTSTPQDTFTTRAGDVANANPVVLDANGEADVWWTPGTAYKFVLKNSAGVTRWTVDNALTPLETTNSLDNASNEPGGRLTLTSVTPVTTSDVTGATTIYYAPHKHNKVPLYDGADWGLYSIGTQISQTTGDTTKSPGAVVANSNYDLFVWSDAGTIRLSRGPAWTSDTARGTGAGTTELERVDGRYVNKASISNGPAAQCGLYVGTIRTDGSSQVNDSAAKRHVWNMHNRTRRAMKAAASGVSWDYSTDTWRQALANTGLQLDFLRGLDEESVRAQTQATASSASASDVSVSIGVDSTTVSSADLVGYHSIAAGTYASVHAAYDGFPGLGRHTLVWLERASTGGTVTWWGGNAGTGTSGITGDVLA